MEGWNAPLPVTTCSGAERRWDELVMVAIRLWSVWLTMGGGLDTLLLVKPGIPPTPKKKRGGGTGVKTSWQSLVVWVVPEPQQPANNYKAPSLPQPPYPISTLSGRGIIFHQILLFLCCDLQIHTLVTACQSLCISGGFIVLSLQFSVDYEPEIAKCKNLLMTLLMTQDPLTWVLACVWFIKNSSH